MTRKEKDDILSTARKRFAIINTAEAHIRDAALDDMKFAYNLEEGQWPISIRTERLRDHRPCLTSNKLRKFISIVSNQALTTRPAIGVTPVDDKSDPGTAKVYESLIRQIEYQSQANVVYQRALEHAIAMGFGYWRVLTRYTGETMDQEIYLEEVKNPFSVYLDPEGVYGFVRVSMTKDDFEQKYPQADAVEFSDVGRGDDYRHWYDPDRLYVAEYFWKEPVTVTLVQVQSPLTGQTEVVKLEKGLTTALLQQQGFQIVKERTMNSHRIRWGTMTGTDIFDVQDWPGMEIPIVEVCGDKQQLGDKLYKRSLIRDAKDPQRMYNYWLTSMTETVALVPKAPFLVTPEEIRGHEAMWDEANRKNQPYLFYNRGGDKKPERERPPEVQTGAMAMLKMADEDIKDVIGIFEPGLGDVSNERSGRAIKLRQSRSDLGTGHFQEEFRNALIRTGKILIDIIPEIYDTERIVRIRDEAGDGQLVPINQTVIDPLTGQSMLIHDLSVGTYDVESSIRVYESRREESTEMMIQALQYAPSVAPYILDLIFKYADWPGADEIADRIKALQSTMSPPSPGGASPHPGPPAVGPPPSSAAPSGATPPSGGSYA